MYYSQLKFNLVISALSMIIFCMHAFLSCTWMLVIWNKLYQLKKQRKYFHKNSCFNSEALNIEVEYRKNIFFFFISLSEFIFCIVNLIVVSEFIYSIYIHDAANHLKQIHNISDSPASFPPTNASICNPKQPVPNLYINYGIQGFRTVMASSLITFNIMISLVYVLMSYIVEVLRSSFNYHQSMKSAYLTLSHKIMLSVLVFVGVSTFIVSWIDEFVLLFFPFTIIPVSMQTYLTVRYSVKLNRVLKWKLADIRVANGRDSIQYRINDKKRKKFKRFIICYNVMVAFFNFGICIRLIRAVLFIIRKPSQLNALRFICIHDSLPTRYQHAFIIVDIILIFFEKFGYFFAFLLIFLLNICTIPYLMRRINLRKINLRSISLNGWSALKIPLLANK